MLADGKSQGFSLFSIVVTPGDTSVFNTGVALGGFVVFLVGFFFRYILPGQQIHYVSASHVFPLGQCIYFFCLEHLSRCGLRIWDIRVGIFKVKTPR